MDEADRPVPEPQGRPDEKQPEAARGDVLAVLPLRDIVVFPHMIVPLFVGRENTLFPYTTLFRSDRKSVV